MDEKKRERMRFAPKETEPQEEEYDLAAELAELTERYPELDPGELLDDWGFRTFCGRRLELEPLWKVYEDFLQMQELMLTYAEARCSHRDRRSTGSGGAGSAEGLSHAQQKKLENWNKLYPHLKMSAKDYLER